MSLNKVFLKVFEEAEDHFANTDLPCEQANDNKTESAQFRQEEADPELIVSHLHSNLSAGDGPHFLSISSKKEEAVRNLKLYNDSFNEEHSSLTEENCPAENKDSSTKTAENSIYRFDHYYTEKHSENENADKSSYDQNVIRFQSERALTDNAHSSETPSTVDPKETKISEVPNTTSSCQSEEISPQGSPAVNHNGPLDIPSTDQTGNCIDFCNLAPGKTSGALDPDPTDPTDPTVPTDPTDSNTLKTIQKDPRPIKGLFTGQESSQGEAELAGNGECLEEDELSENEPISAGTNERYVYDYHPGRQMTGLAEKKSSFQRSGILQDRISLLKEKEAEESKIWTGALPVILTKLPREVVQEFFALGEFLYGKVLDGRKVFGFEGIKKDVGCSTLLLGVAEELIRKGLSLLLVDAKSGDSDLLSLLQVKASERLRTVYEIDEENCQTDGFSNRTQKYSSDAKAEIKNGSNERELIRRQIKENLRKIVLQRSSENKIKKFFRYKEAPIEQPPFYVLSLNHQSELKKKCANVVFKQEFQILARDFDVVLIDSGSCKTKTYGEILTDMSNFSEDGYFLVQDYRKPEREFAKELSIRSMEMQMPCLGIIENFV